MASNLYSIDRYPATSQAAIREFQTRYLALLGAVQPDGWVDRLGALVPTESGDTTFPITQFGIRYTQVNGEDKAKSVGIPKEIRLKTARWDAAYFAQWEKLRKDPFTYARWQTAPAGLVIAEANFRHVNIAALLEAGESTAYLDTGKNFFSATHYSNLYQPVLPTELGVSSSWSNYQSSTKDVLSIANIEAEVITMADVRDENGKRMGVLPDEIWVPTAKAEKLRNLLSKEYLAIAASTATSNTNEPNPYKGRFTIVEVKEFSDADDWYLVDSKLAKAGFDPWIMLRETLPAQISMRTWDENTDYFRDTKNIKVLSEIGYGFGLALPHAIRKIKGA